MEGSNFGIKDSVKKSRALKAEASLAGTDLKGKNTIQFKEFEKEVDNVVDQIIAENNVWIEEQRAKIAGIITGVEESKVWRAFREGLMIFLKQQYKFLTKDYQKGEREIPPELKNPDYLKAQISAFTFDFIQSLKRSEKRGDTSIQALQFAKLSFRCDPDTVDRLLRIYENVDPWIVKRFVVRFSHPENFLNLFIEKREELTDRYPDVSQSVISRILCDNFHQPDEAIRKYLKILSQLKRDYPDTNHWTLSHAALKSPNDPKKFIVAHKKHEVRPERSVEGRFRPRE